MIRKSGSFVGLLDVWVTPNHSLIFQKKFQMGFFFCIFDRRKENCEIFHENCTLCVARERDQRRWLVSRVRESG